MSIFRRATRRAPWMPLHHAGLMAMLKAKGGPAEAAAAPGRSTDSRMALVIMVGTVSYRPARSLVPICARKRLELMGFTLRSS